MRYISLIHGNISTLLSNHRGEQVIAPLLITLRVASRRALTSEAIVSGNIGSIHFNSEGKSTVGNGTLSDEHPVGSTDTHEDTSDELPIAGETAIEEVAI